MSSTNNHPIRRIYFVVLPKAHIIYLSGPLQIFHEYNELGQGDVEIHLCGPSSEMMLHQNATISLLEPLPEELENGDVVFVIGKKNAPDFFDDQLTMQTVKWLKSKSTFNPEILFCGICTGALLLAKAGLLNDKYCTTSPVMREVVSKLAPTAKPLKNRIFVKDRNVWTSAGVSAGIDLSLELIETYLGAHAATQIAKNLMLHIVRSSDYSYLASNLNYRNHDSIETHEAQDYISEHMAQSLNEEGLAAIYDGSYRTAYRRFKQNVGIGMKDYQLKIRADKAKQLLQTSNMSLVEIASTLGFSDVQSFRYAWQKSERVSPTEFRKRLNR